MIRRTPILLLWACLLLALSTAVMARPSDDEILQQVRTAADQVLDRVLARRAELEAHPDRIHDSVSDIVVKYFDFTAMARSAMGKYWPRASDEQRQAVVTEFTELLIRTYGTTALKYSGAPIRYDRVAWSKDDQRARVETTAEPEVGQPVRINYFLHSAEGRWQIYDVVVEDLSLVTNYRASFSNEIRTSGVDGLIAKLRARNEELGG